jgi:hypothetical protein
LASSAEAGGVRSFIGMINPSSDPHWLPDDAVRRSRGDPAALNVRVARPTAAVAHAVPERASARPSRDQAETTAGHAPPDAERGELR